MKTGTELAHDVERQGASTQQRNVMKTGAEMSHDVSGKDKESVL